MRYLYISIILVLIIPLGYWAYTSFYKVNETKVNDDTEVDLVTVERNNADLFGRETLLSLKNKDIHNVQREFQVYVIEDLDDIHILVNRTRALPEYYVPEDLVEPDVRFSFDESLPQRLIREEAARALEALFEGASEDNIHLFAVSGYRSYERQGDIFAFNWQRHGEERATQYSAQAGHSEHQTGLAMDVTSQSVGFQLTPDFGETEEGQWVAENAAKYGFIIRYLEGKEDITGYQYEPWHLRYVGIETAIAIAEQGLTLEEYLHGN